MAWLKLPEVGWPRMTDTRIRHVTMETGGRVRTSVRKPAWARQGGWTDAQAYHTRRQGLRATRLRPSGFGVASRLQAPGSRLQAPGSRLQPPDGGADGG